jgi:hypothetical protein
VRSNNDLKRLGRRGSYRLGKLRTQGVGPAGPPPPLQPRFRRPWHRGPGPLWLLAAVAGAAVTAGGLAAGLWFAPFIGGLAVGLALAGLWLGHTLTQYQRAAIPWTEIAEAGAADAETLDAETLDAETLDAETLDAETVDASVVLAFAADTSVPAAGSLSAGSLGAGAAAARAAREPDRGSGKLAGPAGPTMGG